MQQAKRVHNFIAFFLVIALLISGLYKDNVIMNNTTDRLSTEESWLVTYSVPSQTVASITTIDDSLITSIACTEELISARTVTSLIQRYRRASEHSFSRTDFRLSLVDFLPQLSFLTFIVIAAAVPHDNLSNSVVIGFIHHKDGKKAV